MLELLESSIPLIQGLQDVGVWLEPAMAFFSFLGQEEFYLLVMPALLWCYDLRLGVRVGMLLLISNSLNGMLKMAFGSPRPYWISGRVEALSTESSFGLPSGHAQNAVGVWGLISRDLRTGWATWGAAGLIALISLSRVYLGVHFPLDVVGGLIAGAVVFAGFLIAEGPAIGWLSRQPARMRLLLSLLASLLVLWTGLLVWAATAGQPPPTEWLVTASQADPAGEITDPRDVRPLFSDAGTLFGLAAGAALLPGLAGFNAKGRVILRLARYVLGVIGVVILFYGLRLALPGGDSPVALAGRYLRYALVGFWVVYLAPWAFVRLKLSEPIRAFPQTGN